eukprot:m.44304 g.44304  ORF g.44304 m.44304 type:complete len:95 (-) comp12314_c0_seq1:1076-1360(-)
MTHTHTRKERKKNNKKLFVYSQHLKKKNRDREFRKGRSLLCLSRGALMHGLSLTAHLVGGLLVAAALLLKLPTLLLKHALLLLQVTLHLLVTAQ